MHALLWYGGTNCMVVPLSFCTKEDSTITMELQNSVGTIIARKKKKKSRWHNGLHNPSFYDQYPCFLLPNVEFCIKVQAVNGIYDAQLSV